MSKIRVYELAKELGIENKILLNHIELLGIKNKKTTSSLEDKEITKIKTKLNKMEETRIKSTVIRRRTTKISLDNAKDSLLKKDKIISVHQHKDIKIISNPKQEKENKNKFKKESNNKSAAILVQKVEKEKTINNTFPIKNYKKIKKPIELTVSENIVVSKPSFKKNIIHKFNIQKQRWNRERYNDQFLQKKDKKNLINIKNMKKTEITKPNPIKKRIKIKETISIRDLAKNMGIKVNDLISKLIPKEIILSINQVVDIKTATLIANIFDYRIERIKNIENINQKNIQVKGLKPRAPVVTIMGHVDHGKTSLLDAIRKTNIIEGEAGGITQAIGAYHVHIQNRDIVFLDTPGHEAFTSMRARGAKVTDIVVLVVAADDGIMEQTIEAINHAKAANVPIIVAINKIDKPEANSEGIMRELSSNYNLIPEKWGGDTLYSEISAKQKIGIENLLELILLQADLMELKANPNLLAKGIIIEAKLDKGRGPVATVLIQEGTLKEGDIFVCKKEFGKVRRILDDSGKKLYKAGPSIPVEVIGFSNVPQAGTDFNVVDNEKKARIISSYWICKEREKNLLNSTKLTLEQFYERIKEGTKDLNVILKTDVQGSVEAVSESLKKLSTNDVRLNIIHSSIGTITESDVLLASASDAIIIGFKIKLNMRVIELAKNEGVEIKLYEIIYNVINDIKDAMIGLLEPVYKEIIKGKAKVKEIFKTPKIGIIAGIIVIDGKITSDSYIKVLRNTNIIYNGKLKSLRRFKENVKEVLSGLECGLILENFNDVKVDDIIEAYKREEIKRKL